MLVLLKSRDGESDIPSSLVAFPLILVSHPPLPHHYDLRR
jgi:hypothetical protein